jgi:hypothetical protein
MERKSLWKNFLLLIIGGLFVLHMNTSDSAELLIEDSHELQVNEVYGQ